MNQKFPLPIAALLLISLSAGCGPNTTVTGKVSFSDGSPLTEGEVIFESSTSMARGAIQRDGTYSMMSGELKGIPKGMYQVAIAGFEMERVIPSGLDGVAPTIIPLEIPVDRKYLSTINSGLTCEVKGRTTYNITVEPPTR